MRRKKFDDGNITLDRCRAFVSIHRWMETSGIKTDREAWKIINWLLVKVEEKPESKWAERVK